jgi:hypothetical protein
VLVDALAAKVLKRVKFIPSGISQPVPANVKTAAPETQRVMFFKNQENDAGKGGRRSRQRTAEMKKASPCLIHAVKIARTVLRLH